MTLDIMLIFTGIIILLIGTIATFGFGGITIGRFALPIGAILVILGAIISLLNIGL